LLRKTETELDEGEFSAQGRKNAFSAGKEVYRNGGSGFGAGTGRGPAATAFLKNFAEKFCTNSQGKSGSATALMILRGLRSRVAGQMASECSD